ncbi:MAG TPA: hypothetical protein VMB48_04705 [Steroidobacteraceae bacterium]|nr:hypothetical protein [Steroidobacteraceae bacterium]
MKQLDIVARTREVVRRLWRARDLRCGGQLRCVGQLRPRLALAAAMLCAAAGLPGAAWAQAPGEVSAVAGLDCDRNCLIGFLHSYLDALAHRDPGLGRFSPHVRFTENDVEMPLGEGLWGAVTGVAPTGLEAADRYTGNAAWFGTVEERGEPAYLALRIRVQGGLITEAETVVERKGGRPAPFGDPAKLHHDPAFAEILPPAQRRERERLVAVANGYFSTVEQNDGQLLTTFDPDCQRTENGISTTSGGAGAAAIAQGCEAQFKLGIYRINKRVRERRFPIVDVERGVVVATGFFDHANTFDTYTTTDGRQHRTLLKWPNSISLMEAFKIRNGAIYRVEAVFTYVPYFMHSPWALPGPVAGEAGTGSPDAAAEDAGAPGMSEPQDYGYAPGSAVAGCDRACLIQAADGYMDALVAHDPARVHWAETVRYTENGVPMMIGDGEWGVATGHSAPALTAADPAGGQVAWYGTVEEHGDPAYYAMRMRVRDGAVAEVEAVIVRKGGSGPFGDPARYAADPAFSEELPRLQRTSRRQLIALVDGYFNTVQRNDGTLHTQFDPQCTRAENGQVTTDGSFATAAQGCEAQLRLGTFRYVERVRARRFPIVDEERGVVVAAGFFDMVANFEDYRTTDGKLTPNPIKHPASIDLLEAFKVRGGRIYRIQAVFDDVPYRMPSPWLPEPEEHTAEVDLGLGDAHPGR